MSLCSRWLEIEGCSWLQDNYNGAVSSPEFPDLPAGVAFGSYVVRERIGAGAMATVYRAEHLMLNKPVALKVMDRSLLAAPGPRQRFLNEGRAVASIQHPNVVNVTDVGVFDDIPFLVMELLTGEDLQRHLARHAPLDDAATIRLALPLVAALSAAHEAGVVHRDVKPSNIFLARGPNDQVTVKVLDFGISKLSFDRTEVDLLLTDEHRIVGTPLYLAPEALQGAHEVGPAADQYSLGVVLYQCATGRTPFVGDTLLSLLGALSRGEFPAPHELRPGISPALERVISKAMSADPKERFASLREMGSALLELASERTQVMWDSSFRKLAATGGDPASSRPLALPVPPSASGASLARSAPGRRKLWAAAGAVALMGAVATGAWLTWGPRGSSVRSEVPVAAGAAALPPPASPREETALLTLQPAARAAEPAATNAPRPSEAAAPSEPARDRGRAEAQRPRRPRSARSTGQRVRKPSRREAVAAQSARTKARAAEARAVEASAHDAQASRARGSEVAVEAPMRHGANRSPLLD